jgi:hypothetical protein
MKKTLLAILLSLITSTNISAAKHSRIEADARTIASKTENLKPDVIKLALEAFHNAKSSGVHVKKPIVTVIDYTLASTKKRLWVVDVESKKVLHNALVAHGKHSGENYTTSVSNKTGSLQTSVGVFLTGETYFGRDGYSLRIDGLENGFNDLARKRTIVFHGAPYVSEKFVKAVGRIGRSWGCPAVPKEQAKPIIDNIKNGSLIFAYYKHPQWLSQSKFINTKA